MPDLLQDVGVVPSAAQGVAALAAARARQQQQQQQQAGGDGSQGQSQDVGDAVAAQVGTALQACDTATVSRLGLPCTAVWRRQWRVC